VLPTRLYYGSSSWHPRRQWLLDALDLGKGELRTFAIADISGWAPANDKAPAA
jgi:hypothetical protein